MSGLNIDSLTDRLARTTVETNVNLSFASQGLRLDNAESAKVVVNGIEQCEDLEVFELKGNTLGIDAAEAIGKALETKSKLKRLLWSDLFTGRMKTEIAPALVHLCKGMMKANVQLEELDLSDNAFGPNGMVGLVEFLESPCCYSLKVLKLNNNGLGTTGGKMLAESLLKCYEESCKAGRPLRMKVFVSGRGRLENEGAKALADVFKLMKSLEEVYMPQNGIKHQGITALADAFAVNPNLRVVDLSDNTFTEKGSLPMAQALESLENLEVVNFEDCLTRTAGVTAIANSLANGHNKLKVLKLSGNEIELDGAKAVVDAIKNKPSIETLELKENEFSKKGVIVIQKALAKASKEHILGSFSDDEDDDEYDGGDDDDEEGDDDDEGDYDEEGEEYDDEEEDGEYVDDDDEETEVINVNEDSDSDEKVKKIEDDSKDDDDDGLDIPNLKEDMKKKIKSLVKNPSVEKLKNVVAEDRDAIRVFLEGTASQTEGAILSLMKVAQLCTEEISKTNDIIFGYADGLCKKLLKEDENLLITGLLFSLGLIKGEKKKVELPENKRGPFRLLEHLVFQDYFKESNKKSVWLILNQFKTNLGRDEKFGEDLAERLKNAGFACLS